MMRWRDSGITATTRLPHCACAAGPLFLSCGRPMDVWAVSLREAGMVSLAPMIAFLGVLVLGFAYEWKKKAFEWE
ncbi:NADH-quinone oxidoreductase subunit A [Pandoraea capi]|uniref:NADH-quinone oxidoreductase subunit n=1 Tax=Pandoraea capi TaxID=2508286 RepID=A0ABY6VU52_9BURK|nr:NADH-quinone oxidoreductase subunit A [Pandoraea capi]